MNETIIIEKNIKNEWPIRPAFISLVKDKKESEASFNNDGIYKTDMLKGFLADASQDIDIASPLTLYQIVPQGLIFDVPKNEIEPFEIEYCDKYVKDILKYKQIILIHSGKFFESKNCCKHFREIYGDKACFCLDSRIALLYNAQLDNIHFKNEYKTYLEKFLQIVEEYNFNKKLSSSNQLVVTENPQRNRFYVHYICPYSNLEEFFFPIVAAGRVVAVLMLGQRIPKRIKRENIFEEFRNHETINRAVNIINEAEFGWDTMPDKGLEAILSRIETLESRIDERIQSAENTYVSKTFSEIESVFREIIKNIDYNKPFESLEKFKRALDQILNYICLSFGNDEGGFIRIFGTNSIMNNKKGTISCQLIGDSLYSEHSDYSFSIPQITYEAVEWKKEQILQYANSKVLRDVNHNSDTIRILDTNPFISKMPYILWEREKNGKIGNPYFYDRTRESFYHTLLEPYAILNGVLASEMLEKSMRISGHESAQMIATISDVVNHHFLEKSTSSLLQNIPLFMKKMADIDTMLKVLEGIYQRSAMIFKKNPPEKKEWCDFFRLLVSMNTFFDEKAQRDNLQQIIQAWDRDLNKYDLETNENFFKHIMYNLLDNAIKYGHRGSNIIINAVYYQHKLTISVISYGIEIPESEQGKIFELGYRGKSSEVGTVGGVEGMGIGMFVIKNLCQSLGYNVICNSYIIGNLHIPMHYHFQIQKNKSELFNRLKSSNLNAKYSLEMSLSKEIIDEVVNKNILWEFGFHELEALIEKKTYKNVFTIEIPIYNNFKIKKYEQKNFFDRR